MTENISRRPLYVHPDFAGYYDQIIERPNAARSAFLVEVFASHGVLPPARILDAGCGTGDFSLRLAQRGYRVKGIDISRELVKEAQRKVAAVTLLVPVDIQVGNLLALPEENYDGLLCRGVLNDLIEELDRRTALASLAKAVRPGGILIVDVRDWEKSLIRKQHEPLFRKVILGDQGELTFTSITDLDKARRRLLVHETHSLVRNGKVVNEARYDFTMQCWTKEELHEYLSAARLEELAVYGDFDASKPLGSTDRIVVIAKK